MDERLLAKVQEKIGVVHFIERLAEQGCTSEVCRISTNEHSCILKSSIKEKYREWLAAEARVLEILNQNSSISVPIFYGFFEQDDSSHLLMSYEKGITLTSALRQAVSFSEKRRLITSFGSFLQELHDYKPHDSFIKSEDWLDTQLRRAEAYVENGQTDGTLDLLEVLRNNRPKHVKQTMIHGDCTTDNVLVVNGQVKMFIDVAGMTVGDPRYDEALAVGRFMENLELLNAFYKGYTHYKINKEEYQYFDEGLYTFF
jgi:aminoglycoside phosphotransferase (APT) family kinase protein